MKAGGLALLVLLAGCGAREPCFVSAGEGAGWQRVPLPQDAPELAAPEGVDQFRSDEPAVVWETPEVGGRGSALAGSTLFRFGSHEKDALALEFAQPLAGAKVDVTLDDLGQPLWVGRRIAGRTVHIEWRVPGDHVIAVRVHRHLREEPVVQSLRRGRRMTVRGPSLDYRMPGSLYFRATGGPLTLCQSPGRGLSLDAESLGGPVESSTLSRAARRWP